MGIMMSPEVVAEVGKEEPLPESSKKLGMYFVESDNRRSPFAGGYTTLGTSPVNIHGKPIPDLSKTGGWLAAFFIFGNEMAERMAYFGLSVNMVAFMFYVMHLPFTTSANAINNFLGISQASSLIGGFLADAYLGRYWTIAIFTTLYLLGLSGITLCATLNVLAPNQDDCNQLSLLLGNCEPAKPWQMSYLYTVLYVTGFGAAGIRPCVSSFGADQFDERSRDYNTNLDRFFNFFYLSVTLGAIVAFTAVVYIQMQLGWGFAFGALAVAMAISNLVFFLGTPLYRHRLPGGSPLTRVAQVLVAAFRKRKASFDSSEYVGLYELEGNRCAIKGSAKLPHTDDFRFLDKAALRLDTNTTSPWHLCTVTQVEEAYTLNTHIGRLKLPVTCMPVFPGLSIFLLLSLYYTVFVPISRRITHHPRGASQLQRVGLGLAISILSVGWAGVFERYRRNYAIRQGYEVSFLSPMPGLLEFLYEEAPDAMKSIGSAYAAVAGGLGCFVATILNNIVTSITGNEEKRRNSWLSQNINTGRFDYFYWLLTVLSVINFCVFLYAARRYKYRHGDSTQLSSK
ncbi:putative proton-dependent oligopeptide transporter family, PTR2 family proton/oligopeptide symporter [Helianthus annuus]|nr:putative proton-dependent oligopeptide transporter family, PTR2 family proton/oligopeptide symporter [Helianthus annuus]